MLESQPVMIRRIIREVGFYPSRQNDDITAFDSLGYGVASLGSPLPYCKNSIEIRLYGRANIPLGEKLLVKCKENGYINSTVELIKETADNAWGYCQACDIYDVYCEKETFWANINAFFEEGGWVIPGAGVCIGAIFLSTKEWYWGLLLGLGVLVISIKLHSLSCQKLRQLAMKGIQAKTGIIENR